MRKINIIKKNIKKLSKQIPALNKFIILYRKKRDIKFKNKSRVEVFSNIYSKKLWGGKRFDFYSGRGSYYEELIEPYCAEIRRFIKEKKVKTVIDFGCGDFNVASRFVSEDFKYIGVDIVPQLIKRNQEKYGTDYISFICTDVVESDAPNADLCLVREVFQHLSNNEIICALTHMKKYKYILVTEHVQKRNKLAGNYNIDIVHGRFSGVYLDEPPFSLKTEVVLRLPYPEKEDTEMITSLITT